MLDGLAYKLKAASPQLFRLAERWARVAIGWRYGSRLRAAQRQGRLAGLVGDQNAEIRPLVPADGATLSDFLNSMPKTHLANFRPHGFDQSAVREILNSRAISAYGLFVDESLAAYGLLRVSPSGAAFMGQLVSPEWSGLGLGHFLVAYLHWQASVAELTARSTISRRNTASLRAHASVAEYVVVEELPNDYLMIEFPEPAREPPVLAR